MTTLPESSFAGLDFVEVSREAHQLAESLGTRAHFSALRLAEKADANGELDAAKFWRAVYGTLRPR